MPHAGKCNFCIILNYKIAYNLQTCRGLIQCLSNCKEYTQNSNYQIKIIFNHIIVFSMTPNVYHYPKLWPKRAIWVERPTGAKPGHSCCAKCFWKTLFYFRLKPPIFIIIIFFSKWLYNHISKQWANNYYCQIKKKVNFIKNCTVSC